jgi:hypothetical protein
LAILWISVATPRCSAPIALAKDVLELDCDIQADIDRPQYFAATLANRRRLRMAWDAEPKHLSAGHKHPRLDARLPYVLPEESEAKLNASRNAKVHWACQRLAAVRSLFLPQDAHIRDL